MLNDIFLRRLLIATLFSLLITPFAGGYYLKQQPEYEQYEIAIHYQ